MHLSTEWKAPLMKLKSSCSKCGMSTSVCCGDGGALSSENQTNLHETKLICKRGNMSDQPRPVQFTDFGAITLRASQDSRGAAQG